MTQDFTVSVFFFLVEKGLKIIPNDDKRMNNLTLQKPEAVKSQLKSITERRDSYCAAC